ncbi:MAG: efflux RND transporter periplasmic adaptor subunit [Ginsengibacter sp.]
MKQIKLIVQIVLMVALSLCIVSCGNNSAESTTQSSSKSVAADSANSSNNGNAYTKNEVRISQKQYKAINIELSHLEQKNLSNVLKATGFLKVPPQNKASVTSLLGGTVKSVLVQEGNYVRKGQTLLTVINPQFVEMQHDYLDAQANLNTAQANYTRQQALAKENVNSKRTLQEAEANYKSLQAKVNALQTQFSLLGINPGHIAAGNILSSFAVRSPINGTVAKVNINLGSTVDPSTNLVEVVDNSRLHLDLFVYEQDLPKVKTGQTVDFTLTNLPGKNYTARIYSIGSSFENETKTIAVHAEIKGNKEGLIDGMNVTGLINVGSNHTTAVLSNGIASYGGVDYLFYQKNDSASSGNKDFVFERMRVKKGITSGGYTEVTPLEPLPENAKIVTNGAFYLMAMLTNAGEEE